MAMWTDGLSGYQRENGRKGIRNLVAVLAAADNVNPLARQLAARNPGVVYLPASYGRGQMGRDFELSLRAMERSRMVRSAKPSPDARLCRPAGPIVARA